MDADHLIGLLTRNEPISDPHRDTLHQRERCGQVVASVSIDNDAEAPLEKIIVQ